MKTHQLAFPLLTVLMLTCLLVALDHSTARAEAAGRCAVGEELEKVGRLDAAEQVYLKALESKTDGHCATTNLEALEENETVCAKASALDKAGQKAKAKEAYVKALEAHPKSKCASKALGKMRDKAQNWWSWAATAAKDLIAVVGFVALALASIGLLIWLGLQALTRWSLTKKTRLARWLLHPSLEVKTLDDTSLTTKMGPQVASLVRGKVTPHRTGGINIVTGHAALSDILQPLGDVSSEAKAAVSVVSFFFGSLPRPKYEVTGALQPKGKDGRGVSIELVNKNAQLGSVTLWGRDFEAPADAITAYQRLAAPIAAWIDHQVAEAEGRIESLLSSDLRSWMLFKAGSSWQEDGEETKAKALYQEALAIDPDNIGAMANLGPIEAKAKNYKQAFTLLTDALTGLADRPGFIEARLNPDWYRVKYNLASLHANQASEEERRAPTAAIDQRTSAHREARELAQAAAEQIAKPPQGAGSDLMSLLRKLILPAALVLYAGTNSHDGSGAASTGVTPQSIEELLKRLIDDKLEAPAALGYVTSKRRIPWEIQRDLTFAYTQLGEFDKASAFLKQSLENVPGKKRKSLAEQMLADPSLTPLLKSSVDAQKELQKAAK